MAVVAGMTEERLTALLTQVRLISRMRHKMAQKVRFFLIILLTDGTLVLPDHVVSAYSVQCHLLHARRSVKAVCNRTAENAIGRVIDPVLLEGILRVRAERTVGTLILLLVDSLNVLLEVGSDPSDVLTVWTRNRFMRILMKSCAVLLD